MADESETVTVRMLRTTGQDKTTQWFEYRPGFLLDIVRITWELETMDVELDASVADYLLRAGYAAPLSPGSAPPPAAPQAPVQPPAEKVLNPLVNPPPEPPPPPAAPSWLKPNGG
jgi:hypothetical protein